MEPVRQAPWSDLQQEHLAHRVSERLPEEERALFLHLYRQKPAASHNTQFRSHLIDSLPIKNSASLIDSVLYEQTPLFSAEEAQAALTPLLDKSFPIEGSLFSPFDLTQIAKRALLESGQAPLSPTDWDQKIGDALRQFQLSHPFLLFGDTNWSGWFLGFVHHPVTGDLELWRLNRSGTQGVPMVEWKEYLSPGNTAPWILLPKQSEYTF